MSRDDGHVVAVTPLVTRGLSSERWDIVLLGDGYRIEELPTYQRDVALVVDQIFSSAPFDELRPAINVHRVDVVSNESGAGDRIRDIRRATFFDSAFGENGLDRLLVTNELLALETAINAVPEMNAALMIVNSETYGGSGGSVSVFSRALGALDVALHEMGHSHFGLADEYDFYSDCHDPERARYRGPEPIEPNVTARVDDVKWTHFLSSDVALPTTSNPDCSECDSQPSPVAEGVVGAFEGARYFRCGLYRPAYQCRMRSIEDPFCVVCQDSIRRNLKPYLPKKKKIRSVRS